MEKSVIIRKANASDVEEFVKLYNEVWPDVTYDKRAKAEFILSKSQGINYCAEKDGEIVGSRLSSTVNFRIGNRTLRCIQVGDTCTREDCRGQGILTRMNKSLLHDFFDVEKGEIIWNVSSDQARRVYEKLGWVYIQSFAGLVQVTRPLHIISKIGYHISQLFGQVNWDLKDDIKIVDSTLLKKREVLLAESDLFHVCYDESTFKWRLSSHSGIKVFSDPSYGSIVYKVGERNGLLYVLIGEIFLYEYSLKCFKHLLRKFQDEVRPDVIKASVSLGHPLRKFYKKCMFINNPKRRYFNHGVRISVTDNNKTAYEPDKWAISMLDIDTF